jgi:hypothetical protein
VQGTFDAVTDTRLGRDEVLELMARTNALVTPEQASAENVHLLDPP